MLFFTVAAPIYIPVNSVQGFLFFFSYILGSIVIVDFLMIPILTDGR